jgi:N-methylhydantoinase B
MRARSPPLTVSAPENSIVNALKPKPVPRATSSARCSPTWCSARCGRRCPTACPAEGTSCLWNLNVRGQTDEAGLGNYGFMMAVTSNGGTGARPMKDGLSATAYPSGVKGTPVEIAESITPLIFWRKEFREDSGGAGTTRGGLGQVHRGRQPHRQALRPARRL